MEALAAAAARMDGGGALAADGCSAAAEIRASASPLNEPAQATAPPPNLTARGCERERVERERSRQSSRGALEAPPPPPPPPPAARRATRRSSSAEQGARGARGGRRGATPRRACGRRPPRRAEAARERVGGRAAARRGRRRRWRRSMSRAVTRRSCCRSLRLTCRWGTRRWGRSSTGGCSATSGAPPPFPRFRLSHPSPRPDLPPTLTPPRPSPPKPEAASAMSLTPQRQPLGPSPQH